MEINTKVTLINGNDTIVIENYSTPDKLQTYEIESCETTLKDDNGSTFRVDLGGVNSTELLDRFPAESTEVRIERGPIGSEKLEFTGILKTKPTEFEYGSYTYGLEGSDYTAILQNILVNAAYESMTVEAIVTDLHKKYLGSKYPVEIINKVDMTLTEIFKNEYLFDVLEKICEKTYCVFSITRDKKFRFINPVDAINPNVLTVDNCEQPIKLEEDTSGLFNRLRVEGPLRQSLDTEITWTGDSYTTMFRYPSSNILKASEGKVVFKVNGVEKVLGLRGIHDTAEYWLTAASGLIECNTPPTKGSTLYSKFKYKYPIIYFLDDKDSQAKYGIKEKRIRLMTEDPNDSRKEASIYLYKFSKPVYRMTVRPFSGEYTPGQLIKVNMPELRVIDKTFKIVSVKTTSIYYRDIELQLESW